MWENEGTLSVVLADSHWYRTEQLAFDDDSGGPVVLAGANGWSGSTLVATLAATSEELWRVAECTAVGRVQGVVVAMCYAGNASTVGIDEPTGAELWRRDGYAAVLLASRDRLVLYDESGSLDALDPGTGSSTWSIPLLDGRYGPHVMGDRILAASATEVTMLRWES